MSGLAQLRREPDPDVLALLSDLLSRAECGTLQGIAVVTVTSSGSIGSAWAGAARNDRLRLLGALRLLEARVIDNCNEVPDEETGP